MKRLLVAALLAVFGLTLCCDGASAFGRRWERRRAELYGSLNASLSAQVQYDVAGAENRLASSNSAQIQTEAEKLHAEVQLAVDELKQQATAAVAAESAKLQKQTTEQILALRTEAQREVASELKKLQDQIRSEVAKFRAESEKATSEAIASLKKDVSDEAKKVHADAAAQIKTAHAATEKKLRGEIDKHVQSKVAAAIEAVEKSAPPVEEKKDESQPEPKTPDEATVPKSTESKPVSDEGKKEE